MDIWTTNCAATVQVSVKRGRRIAEKTGRKVEFHHMKSVKKYQIVGNDQKLLRTGVWLRTNERVRNLERKSCKKELIPTVDYVIVWINLEKMK